MQKRTVIMFLLIVMGEILFTGCSSKDHSKKIKVEEYYEAYKEFYREFYDEHIEGELAVVDCGAQILLDENNHPLLAICDMVGGEESWSVNIHIFEYENGEVKELTRKTSLRPNDNLMYIDSVDGVITLFFTEYDENGKQDDGTVGVDIDMIYILEDDNLKVVASEDDENRTTNKYVEFWDNCNSNPLYMAFWSEEEFDEGRKGTLNGSDFELLLSQLIELKPRTSLELKLAYTKFFKEEQIYEQSCFDYVYDNLWYVYESSVNKFYYIGKFGVPVMEDTLNEVPKTINDIEVELSKSFVEELFQEIKIEDIKKFDYMDEKVSVQTQKDVSFELLTSYFWEETGNTTNTNWKIVTTKKDESDRWSEDGIKRVNVESFGEEVQKYIDKGLVDDVHFRLYGFYLQEITIVLAEENYLSLLTEEEKQTYLAEQEIIPEYEKYIKENLGKISDYEYCFAYIDNDNVPELLVIQYDVYGKEIKILSYNNGNVYSSYAGSFDDFLYIPKQNKMLCRSKYRVVSEFYHHIFVGYLENGELTNEHICTKFDDQETETYKLDGVQCSKDEYINFQEHYFGYQGAEGALGTYSSISEAFDDIKIRNNSCKGTGTETLDWKKAYLDYFSDPSKIDFITFTLMDINGDSVPELFINRQILSGISVFYVDKSNKVDHIDFVSSYSAVDGTILTAYGHDGQTEAIYEYNPKSGGYNRAHEGVWTLETPDTVESYMVDGVSYSTFDEYNDAFNSLYESDRLGEINCDKDASILISAISDF